MYIHNVNNSFPKHFNNRWKGKELIRNREKAWFYWGFLGFSGFLAFWGFWVAFLTMAALTTAFSNSANSYHNTAPSQIIKIK